ncbi:efflux RND transporter periplasmic adaptor subunit [Arcobacter arenosus]|uniref:HlyD family secretion protein n=1 Tax=Arcobacter arenosus TaxID=2576037 RepID=A0A5R8XXV0_9BACT|nr:efflux RND transporter periplasmic adaptor subunit [Arcobacter arenosus]TLP35864.1 hypothetical protein FDK22_14525 [Arcobacter arenosus]
MKKLIFLLLPLFLYSQTYMAKIEPYEEFIIYAQASGQIIKLDKNDETKIVTKELIRIDDSLEQKELKIYQNQLKLYNKKLSIAQSNYEKFINIRGKSQSDKDDKYYDILDLKINIDSIKLSIASLKDTISKKSIKVNKLYIKQFDVDKNDYVSTGTQLATAMNISKSKLVVYVSKDDYENISKKKVYINDEKGLAKIKKIDKTLDKTYVSAHKVVLTLDNNEFGQIMKVEFKDE